jgi:small subunit ribosomal protein S21
MQIIVRDNDVEKAMRVLKKKLQREGVYREMKLRRHYEKPSEKRARLQAAAIRRARKHERKRLEKEGVGSRSARGGSNPARSTAPTRKKA